MMGNPKYADDAPVMCFNPAKIWQLAWYSNNQFTVNQNGTWSGNLFGIADEVLHVVPFSQLLIVRYLGSTQDYYVGFNHQIGANSGVVEAGNEVTVIVRPKGDGYAQSWLVGKLTAGESFQDDEVTVQVTAIDLNQGYASVLVHAPSISPTQFPTGPFSPSMSPTISPTTTSPIPFPTLSPSYVPTVLPTVVPSEQPTKYPRKSPTEPPTQCWMATTRCRSSSDCANDCPGYECIRTGRFQRLGTCVAITNNPSNRQEHPSTSPSMTLTIEPSPSPTVSPSIVPSTLPAKVPSEQPTKMVFTALPTESFTHCTAMVRRCLTSFDCANDCPGYECVQTGRFQRTCIAVTNVVTSSESIPAPAQAVVNGYPY